MGLYYALEILFLSFIIDNLSLRVTLKSWKFMTKTVLPRSTGLSEMNRGILSGILWFQDSSSSPVSNSLGKLGILLENYFWDYLARCPAHLLIYILSWYIYIYIYISYLSAFGICSLWLMCWHKIWNMFQFKQAAVTSCLVCPVSSTWCGVQNVINRTDGCQVSPSVPMD